MTNKSVKKDIDEPKEEIGNYLGLWSEAYISQEKALYKLFHETYPKNNDIEDVLIKAAALNNFYSTNIYSIYTVAKHIVDLDIDKRLAKGDETVVNDIARVVVSKDGTTKNFYSFATKYCSHHNELDFPIFDAYVQKVLNHYKRESKFEKYTNAELRIYPVFKRVIQSFREHYQLQEYSLKQIDMFLWELGREKFPNKY